MRPTAKRRRNFMGCFAVSNSDIRKLAGHQNLSTTMGYSRGSADAIARVLGTKKKEDEE